MQERNTDHLLKPLSLLPVQEWDGSLPFAGIAAIREKMRYSNVPDPLKGWDYFYTYRPYGDCVYGIYGINI
jgi:hypothetical protein